MTDKRKGETLDEFLNSLTEKIEEQQGSTIKVGTYLVEITEGIASLVRDLMERAQKSREDLFNASEQIKLHQKLGSHPDDDDPVIQSAWTAVGEVNAYLYVVTELRNLCRDVLGRKDETKH